MVLLYDAERFILEFFDPISLSALQVYHSALPFVPSSTQLRRLYSHELTGALTVTAGLNKSWGACRRVISTTSPVRSLSFCPDNTYIASGTDKDGVQLWKTTTGVLFTTLGGGGNLSCSVLFSADGKRVAVGGKDGTVYLWDIATGVSLITEKKHDQAVTAVLFSPDSTCLASASSDKEIYSWDTGTGHFLAGFSGHVDEVTRLDFSLDSRRLASASKDSTIRVWDRTSPSSLTLKEHHGIVNSVAFSPSGAHIASGSADKTVRIWDASTGKCIATSHAHKKGVIMVKFSSDGCSVVSVSDDKTVKLFIVAGRKSTTLWSIVQFTEKLISGAPFRRMKAVSLMPQSVLSNISEGIDTAAFSVSTAPLALSITGNTFILHDLKPTNDPPFMGRGLPCSVLAFSLDSAYIASGSPVKDIFICDPHLTDETWEQVPLRYQQPRILAASPDGTRFVTSTIGEISLVDAHGGHVCRLLPSLVATESIAAFSPDSQRIAVPSQWTTSIRLFDGRSGAALGEIATSILGVFESVAVCVAFSHDCSHIVTGNSDHALQVRNVATGQRIARLEKAVKGDITCLQFSPNGARIAFGDSNGAVKCWEWNANNTHENPNPHQAAVTSVVFTPNGERVVSGSSEGSLRAWIPESGTPPWGTPSMAIKSLAFHSSPTGLRLFCRSDKQGVEIWDFGTDEKDEPMIPHLSWKTDDGYFLADHSFETKFSMRDDGWLFDGDSRICWIPKIYRPRGNHFFMDGTTLTCTTQTTLLVIDFKPSEQA